MPVGLQIGTLAQQTGLTVDAIRFYEKSGLLKRPARTEGGFRLFRREDVDDLLDQKRAAVRGKIAELKKLERSLESASRKCKQELKQAGAAHKGRCPVLEELLRT